MDLRDVLDVACTGAMLAVVARWLFRLDLELHWAVCIGAVGLLLEPWMTLHLGPHVSASSVSELAMGTVVAMAFLGIAQVARTP
jgi:hypothetical protein